MGVIHFPNPPGLGNPPYTVKGQHPETWPTVEQLTDQQLIHHLEKMERADQQWRNNPTPGKRYDWQKRSPERVREDNKKTRLAITKCLGELMPEAIKRGLRDPYEGVGKPE